MLALWWGFCAILNAWSADRSFRRREIGWGVIQLTFCVLCAILWFGEVR